MEIFRLYLAQSILHKILNNQLQMRRYKGGEETDPLGMAQLPSI